MFSISFFSCHDKPTTYEGLLSYRSSNENLYKYLMDLSKKDRILFNDLLDDFKNSDNIKNYSSLSRHSTESYRLWCAEYMRNNVFQSIREIEDAYDKYLNKQNKKLFIEETLKMQRSGLLYMFNYLYSNYIDFIESLDEDNLTWNDYKEELSDENFFMKRRFTEPLMLRIHYLTEYDINVLINFFINYP